MSFQKKKRFGQHFLNDQNIIEKIVGYVPFNNDDHVLEIGPGTGALTKPLLTRLDHLTVIDIDRDVIAHWQAKQLPQLSIVDQDILDFDISAWLNQHQGEPTRSVNSRRIIGNLPYNISTPILFHLFDNIADIDGMTFMLQKEVIDRMVAAPNSKTYGRLSVMVQYYCHCDAFLHVPPQCFNPPPKVDSAVIHLRPKSERTAIDEKSLEALVKQAFHQRRKTLRNNLKGLCDAECIEAAKLSPMARAETLSVDDFVRLSNFINAA